MNINQLMRHDLTNDYRKNKYSMFISISYEIFSNLQNWAKEKMDEQTWG